jgi:hypothetical protein
MSVGEYLVCPSCANMKEGASIYRCDLKGHIFCDACKKREGMWIVCPVCQEGPDYGIFDPHGSKWTELGRIKQS